MGQYQGALSCRPRGNTLMPPLATAICRVMPPPPPSFFLRPSLVLSHPPFLPPSPPISLCVLPLPSLSLLLLLRLSLYLPPSHSPPLSCLGNFQRPLLVLCSSAERKETFHIVFWLLVEMRLFAVEWSCGYVFRIIFLLLGRELCDVLILKDST